ncbi:MAG TPA: beta-propeller fold lactonase family protein [Polyangia bacterium]|nr:beta-propeller fold lactonase family protein [Polyangia bacterium]
MTFTSPSRTLARLSIVLLAAACSSSSSGPTGGSGGATTGGSGGATGGSGGAPTGGSGGAGGSDAGAGGAAASKVVVYVSGYDDASIAVYGFQAGTLTARTSAPAGMAPSYLTVAPSKKFLYASDEVEASTVTAYAIGADGGLTKLNTVATGGKGTSHLAISPDGKWIVAANYDSDDVSVLGLNADGSVGAKSDQQPGCPSAHNILFDPSGNFLLAACKSDPMVMPTDPKKDSPRILPFAFAAGKLTAGAPVTFGADPRHLAFDASHKHVYAMTEAGNALYWFDYDSATGKVSNPQMVTALDAGAKPGAGGHLAWNGSFLYAGNRTDGSIAIFSVDASGKPSSVGWQKTGTAWIREFAFDPSGKYLIAGNQMASTVTVFAVDAAGKLTAAGTPTTVKGHPAMVLVLELP